MRNENTAAVLGILVLRILLEVYKLFRLYDFFMDNDKISYLKSKLTFAPLNIFVCCKINIIT